MSQKIIIANDHAGFNAKTNLIHVIKELGFIIDDLGCDDASSVDYPDYANKLALAMKNEPNTIGILICGSGIGMSIAANRYQHVRAALCCSTQFAKMARSHNDANVLVLAARFTEPAEMKNIFNTFIETEFAGGKHLLRVHKIKISES
jgi:ribose 5-phosphate isomerase B